MTSADRMLDEVREESRRRWVAEKEAEHRAAGRLDWPGRSTSATPPPPTPEAVDQADADRDAVELARDLWEAREVLAHIRQAAQARRVSPLAALGAVLGRLAAFTPPSRCVPPFTGGPVPLSLYPATMAATGGGKSATSSTAAALLPHTPPHCIGPVSLGSGEGIAELFLESVEVEEDDGDGSTRKVRRKRQTRYGALLVLDEGRALGEMARRTGATIVQTLCTAWVGGPLGNANASAETYRHVPGGNYALGLVTSWQPSRAAALFDDTDGGLPGRFLYVPGSDPSAPDSPPDWPGPLHWSPLPPRLADGLVIPEPLEYPTEARAEVDAAALERLRGVVRVDPLDAHRNLHRLKVAGLLAELDARDEVTLEDWQLAGRILDVSDTVRSTVVDLIRAEAARRERDSNDRAARRELHITATAETRAIVAGARAMARKAHRNASETHTRAELSRAPSSRMKAEASVDQMLEHALAEGWLEAEGDRYRPGRNQPA